jgi:hypothetical protein
MSSDSLAALERTAVEYLQLQLGEHAPRYLTHELSIHERPLEGEGAVEVFSFPFDPAGKEGCGPGEMRFFVVVGATEPNYFPGYGLQPDEAYSMHIGTRFMLEMGISRIDSTQEDAIDHELMRELVRGTNPTATLEHEELVARFRCVEQTFAIYRLRISGLSAMLICGDITPGYYSLTDYPPQVTLRLHLGNLIRQEAREEQRAAEVATRKEQLGKTGTR